MPYLVEVERLEKRFPIKGGILFRREGKHVHAVDGIDFHVEEEETLGLVGESGCGKTTTGKLIMRLIEPTAGTVRFMGQDIFGQDEHE